MFRDTMRTYRRYTVQMGAFGKEFGLGFEGLSCHAYLTLEGFTFETRHPLNR
jgi:hypothetical protein